MLAVLLATTILLLVMFVNRGVNCVGWILFCSTKIDV